MVVWVGALMLGLGFLSGIVLSALMFDDWEYPE